MKDCKVDTTVAICKHMEKALRIPKVHDGWVAQAFEGEVEAVTVDVFRQPERSGLEEFQSLLESYGYPIGELDNTLLCEVYYHHIKQKYVATEHGLTTEYVSRRLKKLRQELEAKGIKSIQRKRK